jgi:hypothetical protein
LPEDEQRLSMEEEVGTMQFRVYGEQIKKWMMKEGENVYKEKRERDKETKEKICMRKKWVYKNKIKSIPRFSKVHYGSQKFQDLRSKLIFPTMCNPITRTSFVPRDHSLPFAHVHLSQSVCISLSPSLI